MAPRDQIYTVTITGKRIENARGELTRRKCWYVVEYERRPGAEPTRTWF